MDRQARERIESWLRDVDRDLGKAETSLSCVMGALEEEGVAMRRALWVQARILEAREDHSGLTVHARLEFERAMAEFDAPTQTLTAGAGI